MRNRLHRKRRALAAAAAAVGVALTAALTAPVAAQDNPAGPLADASAPGGPDDGARQVTLITGDRVMLDEQGEVTGLARAEGRQHIPVRLLAGQDGTYVIPADALPLLTAGTLDRRLFNVTELANKPYRSDERVPVIVSYADGAARERTQNRLLAGDGGPRVTADLASIDSEAMTVPAKDAAATWRTLTRPARAAQDRTGTHSLQVAAGIERISLDALAEPTLDVSVPQIGAPTAWDAGFDGTGVTIAVLDTGIADEHPDLAGGKVVAEKNFTASPDTGDAFGHGTHVASIAAGTGVHSGGTYTGVAPGAELLNGKVLSDIGYGSESGIIAGMEWAVEQGADVINMSLGAIPTQEIDPMEAAVDALSADSDALFVISAGNEGPNPGTVSSPGSADAALTVGAVDDEDQLAIFSSVGPRYGDGAVKPDVTAPGVAIGAAAAPGSLIAQNAEPVADGYVAIDGTSMAAPHAAGAAALLAQANPDLTGDQLKGALIASARPIDGQTPFQQGTGRIDIPAALEQSVVVEQGSINFGRALWPHGDDEPVTRPLTYTNLTDEPVTLRLTAEGTTPSGEPAPEGLFTLDRQDVTIPAAQTATVEVTADPTVVEAEGTYAVEVTATETLADGSDGALNVRTLGSIDREPESYDITVNATGRDGEPSTEWSSIAHDPETGEFHALSTSEGAVTRLPAGDYVLDSTFLVFDEADGTPQSVDWLVRPRLSLTEDTTIELDARDAEPVRFTAPVEDTELAELNVTVDIVTDTGGFFSSGWFTPGVPQGLHTAQTGDVPEGWEMVSHARAAWADGDRSYHSSVANPQGLFTGLDKKVDEGDLAEITVHMGASLPDRLGALSLLDSGPFALGDLRYGPLPRTEHAFVDTTSGEWLLDFSQAAPSGREEAWLHSGFATYEPGQRYEETFNVGVFGPLVDEDSHVSRQGNALYGTISTFTDSAGHEGYSAFDSASITLYREGEEIERIDGFYDFFEFDVPAEQAEYELVTTVNREGVVAGVSTEITTSHRFTSAATPEDEWVPQPVSAVRFSPELALDSTSPAGETVSVPLTVQGSAAGDHLGSLTVSYSVDGGDTWQEAPVEGGAIKVANPAAGGSVSLRAEVTDADGNASTQTIIDAYRTS